MRSIVSVWVFDCDKHTELISEEKSTNDEYMSDSRENSYRPSLIYIFCSNAIKMYTKLAAHEHMRTGLPFLIFYFSLSIFPRFLSFRDFQRT